MKQLFTIVSCMAISVCLADLAMAQGPVRRGLRAAGEATADVARVTGQGIRAGVDAATPSVPAQARSGDTDRNASWRRVQHNGDWWYYTPENSWMVYRDNDWTPYTADTFTPNQQYVDSGNQAVASQGMVFIDSGGRAVICQNGRIVFIDGTALRSVARSQVNAQGYLIEQGTLQSVNRAATGQINVNEGAAATATQSGVQQSTFQSNADAPSAAVGSDVQPGVDVNAGASVSGSANPSAASGNLSTQAGASAAGGASPSTAGTATTGGAASDASTSGSSSTSGTGTSGGATASGSATSR